MAEQQFWKNSYLSKISFCACRRWIFLGVSKLTHFTKLKKLILCLFKKLWFNRNSLIAKFYFFHLFLYFFFCIYVDFIKGACGPVEIWTWAAFGPRSGLWTCLFNGFGICEGCWTQPLSSLGSYLCSFRRDQTHFCFLQSPIKQEDRC